MSNVVVTPATSQVQAASSNASTNAAGNSGEASPDDKNFASVLDDTVTTAAHGTDAQTPLKVAAVAGNLAAETDKQEPPVDIDLSALLPMIAAHFAAAASVTPNKTADGTTHSAAAPQPLTAPPLHTSEVARTIEADDLAATPVAAAAVRTANLADNSGATVESSTAKQGGESQPALVATDRADVEAAPPLGTAHRAASDASPVLRIETPVTTPRWGEELAQKVMWVAKGNDGHAELVLTPPHLGRLEVSVAVKHDGETSLMFVSANQQVRDTLEQSLPRLREILADAGIALGQAGVKSDSEARDGAQFQGRGTRNDATPIGGASPSPITAASQRHGVGLVDTFA